MNIKEATEQIEGAIEAYLAKDNRGLYLIPFRMQRPIIMLGPPGVGKTAVVEQIADRMGINFVSYSITHHTRQSALGLPFIEHAEFDGQEYSVSNTPCRRSSQPSIALGRKAALTRAFSFSTR